MAQMMQQLTDLTAAMGEASRQNAQLRQQMSDDTAARSQRESDFRAEITLIQQQGTQAAQAAAMQAQTAAQAAADASTPSHLHGGGETRADSSAAVSKWAPDSFDGKQESWRIFSLKFRSYLGAFHKGTVGIWMDYAVANRMSNCKRVALDPAAAGASAMIWSALVATCEGAALTICERAGDGEGIEAWRRLNVKYDAQTRQTRVMRLISSWCCSGTSRAATFLTDWMPSTPP